MTQPRPGSLFLYVQNLLGIGHLRRAAALARAAAEAGMEVHFVSGGMPVPHLDTGAATVHQLPAVRAADSSFRVLVDAGGRGIDDAWRAARRDRLLALLDEIRPDIILTELFPFGRRQMRFELLPLLERARAMSPRPKIVSSMRDILVARTDARRNRDIAATVNQYYDLVLVHGDMRLISLADTFPMYDALTCPVRYTGYVLNPLGAGAGIGDGTGAESGGRAGGSGEILVSAGGGAVGGGFMAALARMRRDLPGADRLWRFVTGPQMPEADIRVLEALAGTGMIVERHRPDLAHLIAQSYLSFSQAGYNTLAEILAAGAASVVIPFETGGETEQRLRADLLARRGRLAVVPETELTRARVAAAMQTALACREAGAAANIDLASIDLDGAARTARILSDLPEAA